MHCNCAHCELHADFSRGWIGGVGEVGEVGGGVGGGNACGGILKGAGTPPHPPNYPPRPTPSHRARPTPPAPPNLFGPPAPPHPHHPPARPPALTPTHKSIQLANISNTLSTIRGDCSLYI